MSSTIRGRGTRARPASAWPLAVAAALALGSAGCGHTAMGHRSDQVPLLQPFQIRTAQRQLSLNGFRVEPTGVWDESTRAAATDYQTSRHLPTTGLPDLATLWRLGVDPDPVYNCEMNDTVDCSPPPN